MYGSTLHGAGPQNSFPHIRMVGEGGLRIVPLTPALNIYLSLLYCYYYYWNGWNHYYASVIASVTINNIIP